MYRFNTGVAWLSSVRIVKS